MSRIDSINVYCISFIIESHKVNQSNLNTKYLKYKSTACEIITKNIIIKKINLRFSWKKLFQKCQVILFLTRTGELIHVSYAVHSLISEPKSDIYLAIPIHTLH